MSFVHPGRHTGHRRTLLPLLLWSLPAAGLFAGEVPREPAAGFPAEPKMAQPHPSQPGAPPADAFAQVGGLGADPVPYSVGSALVVLSGPPQDRRLHRVDAETLAISPIAFANPVLVAAGRDLLYVRSGDDGPLAAVDQSGQATPTGATRVAGAGLSPAGRLYFTDRGAGQKLWENDGLGGADRVLFDLQPGWDACRDYGCIELPRQILARDTQVFFLAAPVANGTETLWAYTPGAAEPQQLRAVPAGTRLWPAPGGRVAFVIPDPPEDDSQLWISDGTPAGTHPYAQLFPGYTFDLVATAGPRLFVTVLHDGGSQLYGTDFGSQGFQELHSGYRQRMEELAPAGDRVYFAFDLQPVKGIEPGWSDGNLFEPVHFLDIAPGPAGSLPRHFHALDDGRVVFSAAGANGSGAEPWISDGSEAGSFPLADVAPGAASSAPDHFAEAGSRLFFQAAGGDGARRLFALDLATDNDCPRTQLCLHQGRFEVRVEAAGQAMTFPGRRVLAGEESGVFSFFTGDNWEMLVKVLDGCGLSGHFWVYASAATDVPYQLSVHDRWSGETRTYSSAGASRPILDAGAFATCGADPLPTSLPRPDPPAAAAPLCEDDPSTLCLGRNRLYRVKLDFRTAFESGHATPIPWGSTEASLFTFFSPGNWEALVKVLDGCAINGKMWVFAAGTTDVGWTLEVESRFTGAKRIYESPLGQPSRTVTDIEAFDCP